MADLAPLDPIHAVPLSVCMADCNLFELLLGCTLLVLLLCNSNRPFSSQSEAIIVRRHAPRDTSDSNFHCVSYLSLRVKISDTRIRSVLGTLGLIQEKSTRLVGLLSGGGILTSDSLYLMIVTDCCMSLSWVTY